MMQKSPSKTRVLHSLVFVNPETKMTVSSSAVVELGQRLAYLVEQKEVDLNIRDKWDSTPLYYACLCGYEELVKYLLENGARCEANTFDGERCLYGALTDTIKKLLKSYNMVSSKILRRDLYEEFLRRLLETEMYADVTFCVHSDVIRAHRCVLSVRSSYFAELFRTRWKNRQKIVLKHPLIVPAAFRSILQYLYTGKFEIDKNGIRDCIVLAKQCKMQHLIDLIEEKSKKLESFESTKPGVNVTMILIEETNKWDLQMNFGYLADLALPSELCAVPTGELPFEPEFAPEYADIIFVVNGHRFYCHKGFFCGRSDYFKALLIDHFSESSTSDEDLPMLTLNGVNVEIFVRIMYYIYQDTCELSEELVYDVMCTADMYLLPGLKRLCANCMAGYLQVNSVVNVLKTARLFNLPRLEDQCAEFMAANVDKMLELPEFMLLVREDASQLVNREETDTIEVIDHIRFHITNFISNYSDMQEAEENLKRIDSFLEDLGLDA